MTTFLSRCPSQYQTFIVTRDFIRSHPATGNCPICMELFVPGNNVKQLLPCGHCFHGRCILRWFSSSNTCPICRLTIPLVEVRPRSRRVSNDRVMNGQSHLIRSDTTVSFGEIRRPIFVWFCQLMELCEALFTNKW
ncbi:Zinc finger, RING/FYVE/PHD-type [Cynara cardunculus var. scolymus]|uniref:Zinc finger, RING/FYVE/PHD-type n=1 Tax=Cynara cardunculus var. scolymus TaxID=59895 RepID=A0A103XHP4_CYNCS|nr:Zinc finger, RING/FYVE/PHD-type [Cynara cardunculus var. scolymus]